MPSQQNTTSQATQTGQFSPQGMAAYQSLIPAFANLAQQYMQNPFGNPFFAQQKALGTAQAQQQGGTQMSNITNNLSGMGFGGGASSSPFAMEMMQNQGRSNAGLQAQLGFQNPMQNALALQQGSMGQAASFSPLQTGQTQTGNQTQSTSGLGTWLPGLFGGAMGALTGGTGGGGLLSMLKGGGGFSGGGGGSNPFFMGMGSGGGQAMPTTMSPSRQYGANTSFGGGMPNPYLMGGGQ